MTHVFSTHSIVRFCLLCPSLSFFSFVRLGKLKGKLLLQSDFFISPKSRAKRALDCPFGSIFSQEHKFSNNICFLNRWGQEPFFKPEKIFIFAFSSVLEPNGKRKFSLPEWLLFEYEALIGGKSFSISILKELFIKKDIFWNTSYILTKFRFLNFSIFYLYWI